MSHEAASEMLFSSLIASSREQSSIKISGTRGFVNPVNWFRVHAQRAVCNDTLKKKSKSKVDLKNIKKSSKM